MNVVTRTISAALATGALVLAAAPAQAIESDPYAYSSQPRTICGSIFVNHVDGWAYHVDGKLVEQTAGELRTEIAFPNGTQSLVTARRTDGISGSRSFWLTVNPCTDWEQQARDNAAREQAALAELQRAERKIERQARVIERLRAKLQNR